MNELEKRYYNDRFTKFCNLNENLCEGMIMSYDMNKVENDLKSRFNNVKCVLNRSTNVYRLPSNKPSNDKLCNFEIILTSFDHIDDIIKTVKDVYGWFFVAIQLNNRDDLYFVDWGDGKYLKAMEPNLNMDMFAYIYRFLRNNINSISILVEAKFTVEDFHITELYHKTKLKNINKIKKNGLIPKSEGNFTERVYFSKSIDTIDNMIGGKFVDERPILLRLNYDEYGEEIRNKYVFYKDPRDESAVFTYDCINPKYIQAYYNGTWNNIV